MWFLQSFLRCARNEEDEAREPHLGVDPVSLLASQEFIEDCKGLCDVEMVEPLGATCCELHGAVAKAVPPTELTVKVPEDFVQGGAIKATGPFGEVSLRPPPGVQQGESICFRLAPPCQFRVTVPPWAKGGYQARFHLEDGDEVSVKVPNGLQPGDSFEVLPPAMMVKLPEKCQPNDRIIFWSEAKGSRCPEGWYRFRMPQGFSPGTVVSVRIPVMPAIMQQAGYSPPPNSAESPLPRVSLNNGNNYNDPIDEDLLVPNWVRIARTLK
mmetsp:Transcript_13191/g.27592  ORF Transcript_13191/g.27592 Transcript_13191/m.27592 type:complete len:268 (-) Transcript_13191:8-811(-)